MQIITTLNEILTQKGISVLKFSKEAGIPEGRVYKWLDPGTPAQPKSEDVEKIEKWISSKNLQVSRQEPKPGMRYTPITASDDSLDLKGTTDVDRLLAEKERTIKRLEADWAWLKVQFEKLVGTNDQQKS